MKKSLTVACLGAGFFSQYHYEAWQRNPRCKLVGSADVRIAQAKRSNALKAFSSLEKMLDDVRPDILDIITPPTTHFKAIKTAAQRPIKAIICQKPFCTSIDEAKSAMEFAAATGISLIIHENFRFQPWFRKMKQALNEKLIGDALQFSFRLRTGDGQGADAYLARQPYFRTMPRFLVHETGVHYIDTFRYLFGPIRSVYADLRTLNTHLQGEDAGYIIFEHVSGFRSVLDGNRHLDHKTENTRLTFGEALLEGTDGVLTLEGDGTIYHREFGRTKQSVLMAAKDWGGFSGDCVYALQDHVVSALLDNSALENTATDYLPVLNMVDTIYRSATCGKRLEIPECER